VTTIAIEDADSIDCGLSYSARGHEPVVLNLADDFWPGGAVDSGSGAQEESLFRRTNLCRTLLPTLYPIGDDEALYSPGVSVFKAAEDKGWAAVSPPATLDFLSVPGVRYPQLTADRRLHAGDVQRLKQKVRAMLRTAHMFRHDVVVLGASGCGAWRCPGAQVAEVFFDVIRTEFQGCFDKVVFAIKRGAGDVRLGATTDNFTIFTEVLGRTAVLGRTGVWDRTAVLGVLGR
jgi:uncharacterized protein (TIGR02452 family)